VKSKEIITAMAIAAFAISTATAASAADIDTTTVKPKKAIPFVDAPFFTVNDNRLTLAYQPTATDPGQPGTTAKEVFAFSHFDVWAYGTNFLSATMLKSDHNDPAAPCSAGGACAGATEYYGILRSTFGLNEIFDTHAFSWGPLRNVSVEVGGDLETENNTSAPAKRLFVGGLQFAFDLPYKGYFNVAPMVDKETNHLSFLSTVKPDGLYVPDGTQDFKATWLVETNYYMDLGFLPESVRYFAISGRASWTGPKGTGIGSGAIIPGQVERAIELNSEPIRLTFDASGATRGKKYEHLVDVWVAWRYWQNKFGLDHINSPTCYNNKSGCTENTLNTGVTVKF
jgi:hypothetical protein